MILKVLKDSSEIGDAASDLIVQEINLKPNLLLCTATGETPTNTYTKLVDKKELYPTDQIRVLKLDEWGGVPMSDPMTCEYYLQKFILKPLNISQKNYFGFNSNSTNPEKEILRMKSVLLEQGPIDICVLGLGMNGHIAFNEPPCDPNGECHIAKLSTSSLLHPMAIQMSITPEYGLTLGIKEIIQSKKIIMLINGAHKKKITKEFFSGVISEKIPASYIWSHTEVYCFIDESAKGV
jgi:galactosamine-6-phosphate isomerase